MEGLSLNLKNDAVVPLENAESGRRGREIADSIPLEESTIGNGSRSWLRCENLGYSIKSKQILTNINAIFAPGRITALMGSSGAGKTTLLHALCKRGVGTVTGSMTVNNKKITSKMMREIAKLVPQHDVLIPVLTARETLLYTAALALPVSKGERVDRVDEVINMLGLVDCQHVICGNPDIKGLSGGQLRRVSIGMELLSNPSILLLDEPTSGLDSTNAQVVVDLISALAKGGRTVICTIHQPSFELFSKFDDLLLLDRGLVAYSGPVDRLSEYLSEIGRECPRFTNPADHILSILSEPSESGHDKVFLESSLGKEALTKIDMDTDTMNQYMTKLEESDGGDHADEGYPTSYTSQFFVILRRAFYVTIKDKAQLRTRLAQTIFLAVIISTIFLFMPMSQDRVQDRLSVFFIVLLFLGMSSIMSTALAMPDEKVVLKREYANGYYAVGSYFFARILVLFLFQTLYSFIFGAGIYYLIGLRTEFEYFLVFLCVLLAISLIAGILGFAAGVFFPNTQALAAVVPMIVMPLSLFSGLFITYANIPKFWLFLYYLSFFQYALQIMTVNEFHGNYMEACTKDQVLNPTGLCPYGSCNPANPLDPKPCPGDIVLDKLNYDPDEMGMNFGILVAFFAGFLILGFVFTVRLVRRQR